MAFPYFGCCCGEYEEGEYFKFECKDGEWVVDEGDERYRCPNRCYVAY